MCSQAQLILFFVAMKEQFFRGLEGWLGHTNLEARLDTSHCQCPQRAGMCAEQLLGLAG